MTSVWNWSDTPVNNANADGPLWYEGQPPDTVNNSARDNMAAIARWRKDSTGENVVTGTANALLLATVSPVTSLTAGMSFTFRALSNNTGPATLNVNSIGAKSITTGNGQSLVANDLVAGAIYTVTYTPDNFRLHGAYLSKSGGRVSGDLIIDDATPSILLNKAASGSSSGIVAATNGVQRWVLEMSDPAAELGGNVGSNFLLHRCADDGSILSTPLKIERQNGNMTISSDVYMIKAAPQIVLQPTVATVASILARTTAGVPRWQLTLNDGAVESGGNLGSDFRLAAYSDGGAALGTYVEIKRANGTARFSPGRLISHGGGNMPSVSAWDGNLAVGGGFVIDASKNLNVCRTDVNGAYLQGLMAFADGSLMCNIIADLTIGANAYKPGGGPWTATSDERIKNVLGPYDGGLAQIIQLVPMRYQYKGNDRPPGAGQTDTEKEYVGLIAQDVEGAMPEMVTQGDGWIDGAQVTDMRYLDTTALVYALVNAVKTLSARVTQLEAKLVP